jgi:hypothetical protein
MAWGQLYLYLYLNQFVAEMNPHDTDADV